MKSILFSMTIDLDSGETVPITNLDAGLDPAVLDRALQLLTQACVQLAISYTERRVQLASQHATLPAAAPPAPLENSL